MFTPASMRVYRYPLDIDIPSPPAPAQDHREPFYRRPTANGPDAVALDSPHRIDPRNPQPPHQHNRTQSNNVPTADSERQQHRQRLLPRTGSSTETDSYNDRLPYPRSAPRRRRRDPENERP
jgi:hypothetical protein